MVTRFVPSVNAYAISTRIDDAALTKDIDVVSHAVAAFVVIDDHKGIS